MNITLYKTTDDIKTVNKTLTDGLTLNADITGGCDIISPLLKITTTNNVTSYNYCYIPVWGRYYYINTMTVVPGGAVLISCGVDVLMSYRAYISSCMACVIRSESIGKPTDVVDTSLPIHQSQVTTTAIDLGNPIFTTNPSHGYFLTVQGTNGT